MTVDSGPASILGPCLLTLANTCADLVVAWDEQGRCILWNEAAERVVGRSASEALGRPMRDLMPVADPAMVDACVAATLRGLCVPDAEREFTYPGGARRRLRARCAALQDRTGSVIGGVAVLHDLTPGLIAATACAERDASDAIRRAVFDAAFDAIVIAGPDRRYIDANRAAEELLGRTREDILRHSVGDFSAPGHDGDAVVDEAIRSGTGRGRHRIIRPDGTLRDVEFEVAAGFVPDLLLGVFRDITARVETDRERAASLHAANEARREAVAADERHRALARRIGDLLEEERRALARGLHDEVGQELTALRMMLESGSRAASGEAASVFAASERRAADLLRRVRELSFALRPPMLDDLGLVAAVAANAARFGDATGIRVAFGQDGADRRFDPRVEEAAFRFAQEALTNVARHAAVQEAQVRLWVRGESLFVEVRDAGRGFDAEKLDELPPSVGIPGMRERAEALGGTVTIDSARGRGTIATVVLPALPHPAEPQP